MGQMALRETLELPVPERPQEMLEQPEMQELVRILAMLE
jgi:hypothetical protein